MSSFLIFILGVITGGLVVLFFVYKKQSQHSHILKNVGMSEKPLGLVEKQAQEKEENKKRIFGVFETQRTSTVEPLDWKMGQLSL